MRASRFKVLARSRRSLGLGLVIAFAAASLALGSSASANHLSLTISINKSAKLVAGVYIAVPVQVTCPTDLPNGNFTFLAAETVDVSVTQKTSGQTLVHGGGEYSYTDSSVFGYGGPVGTPLTCDGTPHTYTVNAFPDQDPGKPFGAGKAVMQGTVAIDLRDPTNPFCCSDYNTATTPLQTVKVHG